MTDSLWFYLGSSRRGSPPWEVQTFQFAAYLFLPTSKLWCQWFCFCPQESQRGAMQPQWETEEPGVLASVRPCVSGTTGHSSHHYHLQNPQVPNKACGRYHRIAGGGTTLPRKQAAPETLFQGPPEAADSLLLLMIKVVLGKRSFVKEGRWLGWSEFIF